MRDPAAASCPRALSLLILSGGLLIAFSTFAFADCGRASVRIFGTTGERISACQALDEVLLYFSANGHEVDPNLVVRFKPSVYVRTENPRTDLDELVSLRGSYAATVSEIQILSSTSLSFERRQWGLSWNAAMAYSILEHEMVHSVIIQIMGTRYVKLPHAWHEALAYAVQIDLMPLHLREEVLALYPTEEGFTNTLQINEIVYGFDPDAFAVAAYHTYRKGGRIEFLNRAINFELDMIDVNDLP
jgi:uncharacterized protein DUF6639